MNIKWPPKTSSSVLSIWVLQNTKLHVVLSFSTLISGCRLSKKHRLRFWPLFTCHLFLRQSTRWGENHIYWSVCIQKNSKDSVLMMHVLKTLLSNKMTSFAPYSMKVNSPRHMLRPFGPRPRIQLQHVSLYLKNISEGMMTYFQSHIGQLP